MKKRLCKVILCVLIAVCGLSPADYTVPGVMTPKTVDLWQMDSIVRNATTSRLEGMSVDNNLWFMLLNSTATDTITLGATIDGPSAAFGQAMSFAENAPCADAAKPIVWARTRTNAAWGNWPYFKLEMWVKYNDFDSLQFVAMTDSWRIWTQGATIRYTAYFSDATASTNRDINLTGHLNEWLYVTAIFDETGKQEFSVKNIDGSFNQTVSFNYPGKTLKTTSGFISLASEGGSRRAFNGAIDCMRISRPDIELSFESPSEDTMVGTNALWHFDDQTGVITPDDNSNDITGRDYDLELKPGATLVTPADYPAGNADFGTCLELDGMGGYATTAVTPMIDTSLFNIEFWMKPNPGIVPGANQTVTGALWLFAADTAFRVYLQISDTIIQLRFYASGTSYVVMGNTSIDGNWHHYKLSFDNGLMKMYEDGIQLGTTTAAVTSVPAPATHYFVGADGGSRRYFWGWLDEIRVYGDTTAACGDFGYLPADINKDCYVNIADLKLLVANWLDCTFEGDVNCDSLN